MSDPLGDVLQSFFGYESSQAQQNSINQALAQQDAAHANADSYLGQYNWDGNQALGMLLGGLQAGADGGTGKVGLGGISGYNFSNTVNPQTLQNDPGFQFRMQQAQNALSRASSARGNLGSGAFLKGMDAYTQGLASQEYQQAWERQQAENAANFSRLYGLAGMGEQAGSTLGNLSQQNANAKSSLYGAQGNAQAAGIQAMGNGFTNFTNDLAGMYMNGGMGGGGGPMGGMGNFSALGSLGGAFGGGGGMGSTGTMGYGSLATHFGNGGVY